MIQRSVIHTIYIGRDDVAELDTYEICIYGRTRHRSCKSSQLYMAAEIDRYQHLQSSLTSKRYSSGSRKYISDACPREHSLTIK